MPPSNWTPERLYLLIDHSTKAVVAVCESEEDAGLLTANSAALLEIYAVKGEKCWRPKGA
jgi:hypothetical protein